MKAATIGLPRWIYRPGQASQGEPDRDALECVKSLVPARYDDFVPADDAALLYGIALNDAGFFWECHEILEAVWKAAPQGGRDRILLRACIQTANANLKATMDQPRAATRLYAEAFAELDELARRVRAAEGFSTTFPVERLARAVERPLPPVMFLR